MALTCATIITRRNAITGYVLFFFVFFVSSFLGLHFSFSDWYHQKWHKERKGRKKEANRMDKIRLFPCALTAAGIKKKCRKDRWWHLSPPISSLFFFFFFFLSNTFLILLYPQQFFSSLFFLYVFISFCERSIPSQGLLLVCKSVERRLPPFVRTLRALPQLCLTEGIEAVLVSPRFLSIIALS